MTMDLSADIIDVRNIIARYENLVAGIEYLEERYAQTRLIRTRSKSATCPALNLTHTER